MERREFIVAIDLGTSKIAAVAGVKDALGFITVLAVEQEPSNGCIRRGFVYNVEETAAKIKKVIAKLESKLPNKVARIYIGLSGQSLQAIDHSVSLEFDTETTITDEIIEQLYLEAKKYQPELLDLLDAVHPRYEIDGKNEQNPSGVMCTKIVANYKMVVARPSIKRNIARAAEKAGYPIAGYFVTPLAVGDFLLTDTEKNLGCALIDFGAGTTTLSIYKNGSLRHLVVVPFGGNIITKDICSLNIIEDEAEQVKIRYGRVGVSDSSDQDVAISTSGDVYGAQQIKVFDLNVVIEAREEEIIENIINQIELTEPSKSLGAGIVLTGGAVALKGLAEKIRAKTNCEVRMSSPKRVQSLGTLADAHDPAYLQAISIMAQGKENCAKEMPRPVTPPPMTGTTENAGNGRDSKGGRRRPDKNNNGGFFSGWRKKIENAAGNLFDVEDDTE